MIDVICINPWEGWASSYDNLGRNYKEDNVKCVSSHLFYDKNLVWYGIIYEGLSFCCQTSVSSMALFQKSGVSKISMIHEKLFLFFYQKLSLLCHL